MFCVLFTNDKWRLAPLTCHTVHQTLKLFSIHVLTYLAVITRMRRAVSALLFS